MKSNYRADRKYNNMYARISENELWAEQQHVQNVTHGLKSSGVTYSAGTGIWNRKS